MQNLDQLIKSIGLSIRAAQEETEKYSLELYEKWFDEEIDENGKKKLKPQTITVALPTKNGNYEDKEIPVVALLNHNSLILNEVKIKMALISRWSEEEENIIVDIGPINHHPVGENKKDELIHSSPKSCEVEMIFKARPSGEGISRYIDKFVRVI